MSHFTGLVVMTPHYMKEHTLEDSLEKYNEGIEYPEYSRGEVTDFEKAQFLAFYCANKEQIRYPIYGNEEQEKQKIAESFFEKHPDLLSQFDDLYIKFGYDWNDNRWRKDTGKWEDYTTYNPNSKWDWYEVGGRWGGCLKTKNGKFVDECMLDELDWNEEKNEDTKFHYHKSCVPFAIIVDGEWFEKGQMGWFAFTTNEKSKDVWRNEFNQIFEKIPKNGTEVYLIDFHI